MKIKKFFTIVLLALISFAFTTCDMMGTIVGTLSGMQTYFQSGNNARASASVSGARVEFFVSNLLFGHDSGNGSAWIIGFPPSSHNNGGWYDIDGINRARVYLQNNSEQSSLMRFSIKGIRIDNTIYKIDQNSGEGTQYTGSFSYDNNDQFDIIAGDITKSGNQFLNPASPVLPMDSIPDLLKVKEFVLLVDESKLHINGVLKDDWWNCFSFSIRY
jgi:hypothetical protein